MFWGLLLVSEMSRLGEVVREFQLEAGGLLSRGENVAMALVGEKKSG